VTEPAASGIRLPSLSGIQRTSLLLLAFASVALQLTVSTDASVGCLIGGAVVIANLFILSLIGRLLSAGAAAGSGSKLGAIAIPLKLLLAAVLVYAVFARFKIDAIGFAVGVSTQVIAILIETARIASISRVGGGNA
jgi:small-conductance mechanosensitive channel